VRERRGVEDVEGGHEPVEELVVRGAEGRAPAQEALTLRIPAEVDRPALERDERG
jgi:hypothetical protein